MIAGRRLDVLLEKLPVEGAVPVPFTTCGALLSLSRSHRAPTTERSRRLTFVSPSLPPPSIIESAYRNNNPRLATASFKLKCLCLLNDSTIRRQSMISLYRIIQSADTTFRALAASSPVAPPSDIVVLQTRSLMIDLRANVPCRTLDPPL